jgi:hypothetical protein
MSSAAGSYHYSVGGMGDNSHVPSVYRVRRRNRRAGSKR